MRHRKRPGHPWPIPLQELSLSLPVDCLTYRSDRRARRQAKKMMTMSVPNDPLKPKNHPPTMAKKMKGVYPQPCSQYQGPEEIVVNETKKAARQKRYALPIPPGSPI